MWDNLDHLASRDVIGHSTFDLPDAISYCNPLEPSLCLYRFLEILGPKHMHIAIILVEKGYFSEGAPT